MAGSVIAVATGKGGAGKSSIVSALAGTLSEYGRRVAVVELDWQGDLADDFGVREAQEADGGVTVASAVVAGRALSKGVTARPSLSYFPGGQALMDLPAGFSGFESGLGSAIDRLRSKFDVILVDTPPTSDVLQRVSLLASDWLLIPTPPDMSSLRALFAITQRLVEVEVSNPRLRFLGVVLFGVPTSATRIRAEARATLEAVLGDTVPLFETTIRHAFATAYECRQRGMLPRELANASADAEPFWKALAEGREPERVPSTALSLAGDYAHLANEVLLRLKDGD